MNDNVLYFLMLCLVVGFISFITWLDYKRENNHKNKK